MVLDLPVLGEKDWGPKILTAITSASESGPGGSIVSASASALSAGAVPTVVLGGTPSARTLALGIPSGAPGGPPSLRGTYAARPAANTVPDATIYYPTDVAEAYRSNGTVWAVVQSGGNELGYAQSTAIFSTLAVVGAPADVPGLTVTFVAGERPVEIRLNCHVTNQGSRYVVPSIVLGGTVRARGSLVPTLVDAWQSMYVSARVSGLTPGTSYTAKITLYSGDASFNARITGDATNPMFISVVTV